MDIYISQFLLSGDRPLPPYKEEHGINKEKNYIDAHILKKNVSACRPSQLLSGSCVVSLCQSTFFNLQSAVTLSCLLRAINQLLLPFEAALFPIKILVFCACLDVVSVTQLLLANLTPIDYSVLLLNAAESWQHISVLTGICYRCWDLFGQACQVDRRQPSILRSVATNRPLAWRSVASPISAEFWIILDSFGWSLLKFVDPLQTPIRVTADSCHLKFKHI
jgi:hypothetical protein